jgi:hypothetical protein
MHNAWNKEMKVFGQSYEETHILDSAVLIMPLVFFMQAVRITLSIFKGLIDDYSRILGLLAL